MSSFGTEGRAADGAARLARGMALGHNRGKGAAEMAMGKAIGQSDRGDRAKRLARGEALKPQGYTADQVRVWQRKFD